MLVSQNRYDEVRIASEGSFFPFLHCCFLDCGEGRRELHTSQGSEVQKHPQAKTPFCELMIKNTSAFISHIVSHTDGSGSQCKVLRPGTAPWQLRS